MAGKFRDDISNGSPCRQTNEQTNKQTNTQTVTTENTTTLAGRVEQ